jgi:hypothetical protein
MESIGKVIKMGNPLTSNESTSMVQSSTNIPQRQNLGIAREKIVAMLAVLNKRWLSQGWRVMDPKDAEPMALAWIEILDKYQIPYEHYHGLYLRAIETRTFRIAQGLNATEFTAELMASCWQSYCEQQNQERKIGIDKQLEMGGEPCPDDIAEKLKKFGVRI